MLRDFFSLLRVRQWLKNLMLFFAPFFGGTLFTGAPASRLLPPFGVFCLVSSATYICNDVFDQHNDRHHPDKRTRAIASGKISISSALFFAAFLLISSLLIAWNISSMFLAILIAYVALSLAYSVKLKEIILLDIFCISAGFLLRLQAGGVAFNVPISEWLFTSVFLLSVFLCMGKRLAEKQHLGEDARYHRKVLMAYPKNFLEGTMYMSGSSVLVTYAMYAISRHSMLLLYSVPLCCFGLLRYLFRIRSGKSGDPTESLVSDVPLMIIGVAWVSLVGWGIYGR
ncbi:MAG: decaprenyl-phosphate phosphoribosyltransferase [Desulfuromonadaceae bacterium]|nr:decaprenyl-phosphate phosphoribosyltransferase [Desulfuromonadaceae bacterium]